MGSPLDIGRSSVYVGERNVDIDKGATAIQYYELTDGTNDFRWGINISGDFVVEYNIPGWDTLLSE
jgi:hypothetical protein